MLLDNINLFYAKLKSGEKVITKSAKSLVEFCAHFTVAWLAAKIVGRILLEHPRNSQASIWREVR